MTEFYMRAMNAAYPHKNLAFRKMHGAGNDFVVIDSRAGAARVTEPLARAIGDRHRGVGFDQLAEIRSDGDGIALDFWNSDGTRAGACGNATRCVAWLIMHEQDATNLTIRTERGKLIAEMRGEEVWVNMGPPVLDWADVPLAHEVDLLHLPLSGDPVAVGMGNPHAVFFVDDVETVDVAGLGPEIETHPLFPEKTNVEFAQVRTRNDIRMRVWERGTGITLACGSGACATAVAGYLRGLTDRKVRIQVDGGWLTLDWQDDGVWMTGPVASVFEASLSAEFLASI